MGAHNPDRSVAAVFARHLDLEVQLDPRLCDDSLKEAAEHLLGLASEVPILTPRAFIEALDDS